MNISEIKKLSKRFNDDGWEVKCWVNNNLVYDSENKTKVSHKAPKEIKGDYDLSIHGNKIVLVDNNDGTTVEAKCHPEDVFDIGVGIREAFNKLNDRREATKPIQPGDWVEVINNGKSYTTYTDWLYKYLSFSQVCRFDYDRTPVSKTRGQVLCVAPHLSADDKTLAAIETVDKTIYLLSVDGLRRVAKV